MVELDYQLDFKAKFDSEHYPMVRKLGTTRECRPSLRPVEPHPVPNVPRPWPGGRSQKLTSYLLRIFVKREPKAGDSGKLVILDNNHNYSGAQQ